MTRMILIRHGEIDANVERLWHGSTDSDLNHCGLQQAKFMGDELGKRLPEISSIYASPLKRTMKTAAALGKTTGKTPIALPGIREYGIGELEGTAYEDLQNEHGFFTRISDNQDFAPKGGESVNQVRDRMLSALREIVNRHMGETVALVSHGAAMAIALATLLKGAPFPFHDYHMSNTGISVLDWSGEPELVSFNDTRHLQT